MFLVRFVRLRLMCVPTAPGCCAHARVGCVAHKQLCYAERYAESRVSAARRAPHAPALTHLRSLHSLPQGTDSERCGRCWAAGARGTTAVEGALRRPSGAARRRRGCRPGGVAARRAGTHSLSRAAHGRVTPQRCHISGHHGWRRQRARGERHAGSSVRDCRAHGGRHAACRLGGLETRGASDAGAAAARCAARRNSRCCRICRGCALRASMACSHGRRQGRCSRGGRRTTTRGRDKGGLGEPRSTA